MTHDEAVYELERVRGFVGSASDFMSAVVEVLNKEYQGARIQVGRRRDAPPKSKRVGERSTRSPALHKIRPKPRR